MVRIVKSTLLPSFQCYQIILHHGFPWALFEILTQFFISYPYQWDLFRQRCSNAIHPDKFTGLTNIMFANYVYDDYHYDDDEDDVVSFISMSRPNYRQVRLVEWLEPSQVQSARTYPGEFSEWHQNILTGGKIWKYAWLLACQPYNNWLCQRRSLGRSRLMLGLYIQPTHPHPSQSFPLGLRLGLYCTAVDCAGS